MLLELGREQTEKGKAFYDVYSGDEQHVPVVIGKRTIFYHPDVVWKSKSYKLIFEVALNEDDRQLVGEVVLSTLAEVDKLFIVTDAGKEEMEKKSNMIHEKLREYNNKFLRWGVTIIHIPKGMRTDREIKKLRVKELKERDYLWNDTG